MSAAETSGGSKASSEKADASAWLAVSAGTVGALMATLDISITNAALPQIQGEIGASGTEGTWISTAYLVAEIIMIPLSGWFTRLLGLRNFLLVMTTLFVAFSILCGLSTSLGMMIFGRVGQGFSGGAMIPTALTIVSTRLPPAQQPIGIALFGLTAVLGPVLGPLIGGWLTENVSWHYAFFLNLPIGIGLLALLLIGLEHRKVEPERLLEADWLGILGLALFLGCFTVVMEEGQRERWFESSFIVWLSIASVIGLAVLLVGQRLAREPVINLSILLERSFGSVFVMSLMIGAALYGILYLIPQFLSGVTGYNAFQSGTIVLISGIPTLLFMPFFPLLVRILDIRLAIAIGLFFYAWSCYADSGLTSDAAGGDFYFSQILRGIGQAFALLFLNQAATSAVAKEQAEDASGLFNAARNLGGSIGLAVISTMQERRTSFHSERISETLNANSVSLQQQLSQSGSDPESLQRALRVLAQTVQGQATVMAFNDLFVLFAIGLLMTIPFVLFLKPLPKGQAMAVH